MKIEAIKLSPKKGGNGYVSSYSISIGRKEAEACQLLNKRIIKCVDEENHEIIIRAKQYCLTIDIIQTVCQMKRDADKEKRLIKSKYCTEPCSFSMSEGMELWKALWSGKEVNLSEESLKAYLSKLPIETIADLVLLMYMGRDFDADMQQEPGEKRFLEFYDRYNDTVLGREKDVLIRTLIGKLPLSIYLESGVRILNAPKGTSISDLPPLDWSEYCNQHNSDIGDEIIW